MIRIGARAGVRGHYVVECRVVDLGYGGAVVGDPGADEEDVEAHQGQPFAERDDLLRFGHVEVFDPQASRGPLGQGLQPGLRGAHRADDRPSAPEEFGGQPAADALRDSDDEDDAPVVCGHGCLRILTCCGLVSSTLAVPLIPLIAAGFVPVEPPWVKTGRRPPPQGAWS
jgi:hypothetical protein